MALSDAYEESLGTLSNSLSRGASLFKDLQDAKNKSTLRQLLSYQESIYSNHDPENPDNDGYKQKLMRTFDEKDFNQLETDTLQLMYDKMNELNVNDQVRRMWEEEYLPQFKQDLNDAKYSAYVTNYATTTAQVWETYVETVGKNSNLNYSEKRQKLEEYWRDVNLDAVKPYVSRLTSIDEAMEIMQTSCVTQYVDNYYAKPENEYKDPYKLSDQALEDLRSQLPSGTELDADTEAALRASAVNQAKAYESRLQGIATEAQNEITRQFMTRYVNGEDFTADDVIQAAINAGAVKDGEVDRHWVAFLEPYLEASDAQHTVEAATAQVNAEIEVVNNLTAQDVLDTAQSVSDGTFVFSPSTVHEGEVSTPTAGTKVPLPKKRAYSAPILSTEDGTEGTGMSITETVEVTPQGVVEVKGEEIPAQVIENDDGTVYVISDEPIEELNAFAVSAPAEDSRSERIAAAEAEIRKNHALDRNYKFDTETMNSPVSAEYLQKKYELTEVEAEQYANAINSINEEAPEPGKFSHPVSIGPSSHVYMVAEKRPGFDKNYMPYEGSEEEQLSDIAAAALELTQMTEGTDFPNMFNADGDINYDNSRGSYTYKYNGLPDIPTNYAPVVMALCQENGIEYDTDSYSVYKMAEMVYNLEMAGAFTNPKKALAVQTLAVMRLNPEITPEAYNAQMMQYKTAGVLTDDEIDTYNLGKHAFAGDLSQNSSYNQSLTLAYNKAFRALFGMDYSGTNQSTVNADNTKADQWFQMQRDLERELTLAYQLDPTGTAADPLKTVNEIVTRLTDKSFSEGLLNAVLSSHANFASWLTSTSNQIQLGDNATVSDMLDDYFQNPGKYKDYYDTGIMEAVADRYYNPTDTRVTNAGIKKGIAKNQIEELSEDFFGKKYNELTIPEKNKLLFSYAYARTRQELSRSVCNTFGYTMDEIYGNVSVAASDSMGGGMAVVTRDGRVYMSGDAPNGGHNWLIGSVSKRTLENISKGATTISFAEISTYGVKTFNDQNYTFDKAGSALTRQKNVGDIVRPIIGDFNEQWKKDKDKGMELTDIYEAVQPGRYNFVDLGSSARSN